jgi:ABC-type sugar transport system ATPase subunit
MSDLHLASVTKQFGATNVLSGVDLTVGRGDFTVLYGAPASGKSVLLRMVVGLETPDTGVLRIRGVDATSLRPGERNIGYVPQSFALFPNKSVHDNIGYPLTIAREKPASVSERVGTVAELLGISMLLDRTPDQLSGGQKQRVAIARGLVRETEIYVLDDPLVGLDFKLRERLVDDLRATRRALNATFVYATSDANEALALGSHIAILADGVVVEHDTPNTLYRHPNRLETMTRLCFPEANVLEGRIEFAGEQSLFISDFGTVTVVLNRPPAEGEEVRAITRAEHVSIGSSPSGPGLGGRSTVVMREDLGAEEIVYLSAEGQKLIALVRADCIDQASIELGESVEFHIAAETVIVFAGQERIGHGQVGSNAYPVGVN